jgi:predicted dehydrogenase
MKMKDINLALIGCGRIAFLLEYDPLRYKPCTHFGGARSAGLSIKSACDINSGRLKSFGLAAGIPGKNLFTDYNALIAETGPELVIIATWTESHARIGIAAARGGARVIICEKPIAPGLKEARTLINVCKKNNTRLIINHERRYDPRYRTVKSLIEKGAIGDLKSIHASVLTSGFMGKSDPSAGGGPLLHDGTHLIDIIRFLAGDIARVSGEFQRYGRRSGFEDRAAAWMKSKSGIDIFIEAGGGMNYFSFELEITGTEGKIIIGNGYERLYRSVKSTHYANFRDLKESHFPKNNGMNCFKKLYVEAKSLIKSKSAGPASSGMDGYRAVEAIHAVYLSSHLGGRWIDLPVQDEMINLKKIFNL